MEVCGLQDTQYPDSDVGNEEEHYKQYLLLSQIPHSKAEPYKGFLSRYIPMQFLGPAEKGT